MNRITKDQHYVPRFYLRNFAKVIGQGKKAKNLVSFYQFNTKIYKETIPTKSICYKTYFYGRDGIMEESFSIKEGKWSTVIKDILSDDFSSLSRLSESLIKEFSIYQFVRTLATYNFNRDSMKKVIVTILTENRRLQKMSREEVESFVEDKIENDFPPADLVELCDELILSLDDLQVPIIKFTTS